MSTTKSTPRELAALCDEADRIAEVAMTIADDGTATFPPHAVDLVRRMREQGPILATAVRAICAERDVLRSRVEKAEAILSAPEIHNFAAGVWTEAAHQRARWGSDHDSGKAPSDWFWLVGYLAGKALAAHIGGNVEKALHHTISSAAVLANWHAAILGKTNMRPGIEEPRALEAGDE